MRRRVPLISLLLAAALLAGQWLCAVHDTAHEFAASTAQTCAVCVFANGAGSGALPAFAHPSIDGGSVAPDHAPSADPLAAVSRHHPIRGPPALLA